MHRLIPSSLLCLSAILLAPLCSELACAQSTDALPTATAIRADGPVRIDGKLDEPFWSRAPVQSGFTALTRRGKSRAVGEPTEFRIAFDEEAILVGITCHQPRMDQLIAKVTDRDGPVWSDDSVEVFLRHNDRFYYHFSVNSLATRFDVRAPVKEDVAKEEMAAGLLWNGVWQAAVQRGSDQWTVEMRIPLATLDIGPTPPTTWRLNVARHMAQDKENFSWAPVERGFGQITLQGFLKGIDIQPGQFPLKTADLDFPSLLVGRNHLPLKFPADRPGPYRLRASLRAMQPDAAVRTIQDQTLSAADGLLSADVVIPVTQVGLTEELTLQIDDAKTQRPLFLRAHQFRAPDPLEASLDWAVYYATDPAAHLAVKLALAPGAAQGKLTATLYAVQSTQPLATQSRAIESPGDLQVDIPLKDLPRGAYRLLVTAHLPQTGQWSKELWFQKVKGPFPASTTSAAP